MATEPRWTRLPMRARPHRNPLADNDDPHPDSPMEFDAFLRSGPFAQFHDRHPDSSKRVEILDIGSAFGGMLMALAPLFPDQLMCGLEIRSKVVEFAQGRVTSAIEASKQDTTAPRFDNIYFVQLNVMKFGCNCFTRGQLQRVFICYPDPHFKKRNFRRRIVSPGMVPLYAYWLAIGGLLYTVTDVEELHVWMVQCLDECPLFQRVSENELHDLAPSEKQILEIAKHTSEDAQRTARKKLTVHFAIHRRVDTSIVTSL